MLSDKHTEVEHLAVQNNLFVMPEASLEDLTSKKSAVYFMFTNSLTHPHACVHMFVICTYIFIYIYIYGTNIFSIKVLSHLMMLHVGLKVLVMNLEILINVDISYTEYFWSLYYVLNITWC